MMTIKYICDVCKNNKEKKELIRLVAHSKLTATKKGDLSISSRDICITCYQKIFGGS